MFIDYDLIGKRLAAFRKSKLFTQESLAEKTDLSNNYISNIENNRSIPSLETLMKLCEALEITPNQVLMGITVSSAEYMTSELTAMFRECSPKEKRLIRGFISLLKHERE